MGDKIAVYIVLGNSAGEWRSWVEGVYYNKAQAYDAAVIIEEDDDWGNSYYVQEGYLYE